MNEQDFLTRVMDLARLTGWHCMHPRPAYTSKGWRTAIQGDRGAPDLLLARGGRVIAAELKSESGRLGVGQAEWLAALGDHGRLWRPSDWTAVVETLEKEGKQ